MELMENFDPEINQIHTLECIKRLMMLYDEDGTCYCRQAEFVALYVLYNVDTDIMNIYICTDGSIYKRYSICRNNFLCTFH